MNSARITIIGMPWAGKSTIGLAVARQLGVDFIDLYHEVELQEKESLIEVMEHKGWEYFLDREYSFLQSIEDNKRVVISPAGSIIYHQQSMDWLKKNSVICFLDAPFEIIEKRSIEKPKAVVGLKEKGLRKLYDERLPVYKKWSDFILETKEKNTEQVVSEVLSHLSQ